MKCKEIKGYENYLVFEDGTILNSNTNRELKLEKTNRGYYRIAVCKNNKVKRYSIHRLVAELFIPNPLNLETVNHKDGDKSNNSISNLEWMTQEENQNHAVINNLCPRGSRNGNSKWTEDMIHSVCELIQNGLPRKPILEITGISKATFDDIRRRRTWRHISMDYSW